MVEACTSTMRATAPRACSSVSPALDSRSIAPPGSLSVATSCARDDALASSHAVVAIAVPIAPLSVRRKLISPAALVRSEEHTSELQSLMRISYAVFCLKKKKQNKHIILHLQTLKDASTTSKQHRKQ